MMVSGKWRQSFQEENKGYNFQKGRDSHNKSERQKAGANDFDPTRDARTQRTHVQNCRSGYDKG
jgi:hypothetical protein